MKHEGMNPYRKIIIFLISAFTMVSCGIEGDPGHCYFSLEWEYYNENYGVIDYEDDNPDVPEFSQIVSKMNYECYPGVYYYSYKSIDSDSVQHYFEGSYELIQNSGTSSGIFRDGMDGADTYFQLNLLILGNDSAIQKNAGRIESEISSGPDLEYERTQGQWTLKVKGKTGKTIK
jgi:hypothetical protein